jgi:hypothetical protein
MEQICSLNIKNGQLFRPFRWDHPSLPQQAQNPLVQVFGKRKLRDEHHGDWRRNPKGNRPTDRVSESHQGFISEERVVKVRANKASGRQK